MRKKSSEWTHLAGNIIRNLRNNIYPLKLDDCQFRFYILISQPEDSNILPQFTRDQVIAGKSTLYDMEVDCTQKHIITACQDRNIRVYNINSGKHSKTFEGSVGDEGSLIKVSASQKIQIKIAVTKGCPWTFKVTSTIFTPMSFVNVNISLTQYVKVKNFEFQVAWRFRGAHHHFCCKFLLLKNMFHPMIGKTLENINLRGQFIEL